MRVPCRDRSTIHIVGDDFSSQEHYLGIDMYANREDFGLSRPVTYSFQFFNSTSRVSLDIPQDVLHD